MPSLKGEAKLGIVVHACYPMFQEDYDFEAILANIVRPYVKIQIK
jgi:hypothetical protein